MPKQLPKKIMRILQETKGRMHAVYSGQLRELILFGSYARGDYTKGSDIDILMLLEGMEEKVSEREKYLPTICDLSLKYDIVISLVPMDRATYESKKTPLVLNVMREGVTI